MKLKRRSSVMSDGFEDDELLEKKRELQKLKLEREVMKLKAENVELEKKIKSLSENVGDGTSADAKSMAVAGMLASLIKAGVKPEEASEFLTKMNPEALAVLSSMTSSNPYLPIFLFLASREKGTSSQGLTARDVIETNRLVLETAEKLAGKEGKGSNVAEVLKEMVNMVKTMYDNRLLEALEDIKNAVSRGGTLDEIIADKNKMAFLERIFSKNQLDPQVQLKLEEMRQQHELNLKRLELEMLKLRAQILGEKRKRQTLAYALRRLGQAVGEGIAAASAEAPSPLQYTYQPPPQQTSATPEFRLKCPACGQDLGMHKIGDKVKCPKCGAEWEVRAE
jgi:predicted Zn-ribbon and HTH transcriptional regulator